MADFRDDDLFESTKMTFGQHLDELRVCLFRAVIGLVIGVGIGLYFADSVVLFISGPMTDALKKHYTEASKKKYEEWLVQYKEQGGKAPFTTEQIEAKVVAGQLLFDIYYIQPSQVDDAMRHVYPDLLKGIEAPVPPPVPEGERTWKQQQVDARADLVPMFLWRDVEDDGRISLKGLAAQEAFMIWLKAGFVSGFMLASPWIFYQLWIFIAAGLYPQEKRYIHIFLPFSVALFMAGAALAFFGVFQFVLGFLFQFNTSMGIDPDPRISEWLSFVLFLPLGFGVAFQLPLVMLFLQRIGIFSVEVYLDKWRIAVLVIAVLSMLLTPADPMSMLAMALPLVALYFLGIVLCRYFPKRKGFLEE